MHIYEYPHKHVGSVFNVVKLSALNKSLWRNAPSKCFPINKFAQQLGARFIWLELTNMHDEQSVNSLNVKGDYVKNQPFKMPTWASTSWIPTYFSSILQPSAFELIGNTVPISKRSKANIKAKSQLAG